MISNKNKSVTINKRKYEIFFSVKDAQYISERYCAKDDPGDHLSFVDIEKVIIDYQAIKKMNRSRIYFVKPLEGRRYMVVAFL